MHKLYILMRNDIPSMNPGKAMAQAAHAQAEFNDYIEKNSDYSDTIWEEYSSWKEDRSFGTTIVLSASIADIKKELETAVYDDLVFGIVNDPTYPFTVNNEVAHLLYETGKYPVEYRGDYAVVTRKELTCAWIFTNRKIDLELF